MNSHDLPRISTCPELYHPEIYRSALILQYLLPGTPCLYYGDEVGLRGWAGSPEGARFPMEWEEDRWDKEMLHFFRELNQLKSHHPVLAWGNLIQLYADQDTLVFGRFLGEGCLLGVINRTAQVKTLSLNLSPWCIQSLREVFHGSPEFVLQDVWKLTLAAFTGGLWEGHLIFRRVENNNFGCNGSYLFQCSFFSLHL